MFFIVSHERCHMSQWFSQWELCLFFAFLLSWHSHIVVSPSSICFFPVKLYGRNFVPVISFGQDLVRVKFSGQNYVPVNFSTKLAMFQWKKRWKFLCSPFLWYRMSQMLLKIFAIVQTIELWQHPVFYPFSFLSFICPFWICVPFWCVA